MQFLQFANVDEIIELIEIRAQIARVQIDDEFISYLRDIDENSNHNALNVEFNVLHAFIETNLRQCVVRNYVREYSSHHANEFAQIYMFAKNNDFSTFDIVEIDDENRINQIAIVHVNERFEIRVES
jgi:DNA polymerase III delta subunit